MSEPTSSPTPDPALSEADRVDPPEPGSAWVEDHAPPATEAERQALETVRSLSRLEESN